MPQASIRIHMVPQALFEFLDLREAAFIFSTPQELAIDPDFK